MCSVESENMLHVSIYAAETTSRDVKRSGGATVTIRCHSDFFAYPACFLPSSKLMDILFQFESLTPSLWFQIARRASHCLSSEFR